MNHKNVWRKRQIILPEGLVEKLFEWHGGQFTAVYGLASTGMRDLVSLSMIDNAIAELEQDKKKVRGKDAKHLRATLSGLEETHIFWKENAAQGSGMDMKESDYEYDHQDYGMSEADEDEINVKSG